MKKTTKNGFPVGKLIAIILIVLLVAVLSQPKLLFFLNEYQQDALSAFVKNYLSAYQPLQDAEGGFDFLRLLALVLMAFGCWAFSAVIGLILSRIHFKKRHAETVKTLIGSLIKYAIVIYGVIYGLSILGFNVGAVIASLGVLGLIIGFGAQSLIEDVITGLFLVLEGQIQVGDIISISDYRGTVTNIGVRTTTITDAGGNAKIMNNSDIRNMVNLSTLDSKAAVIAPIAYETDLEKAEEVVKTLCGKLPEMYPKIFPVPADYVGVDALNDHSVDLKVVATVKEENIFTARRLLNREIFLAFGEAGIEIPFMQQVVTMKK